jgi:hypothetical protein
LNSCGKAQGENSLKFKKVLGHLIAEDRISSGLARSLEWSLDNYLGSLALRHLEYPPTVKRLKDLSFKQFLTLLKLNVLMFYVPGLGTKRIRELRLAVARYIDEHNLKHKFSYVEEPERRKRYGWSLIDKYGYGIRIQV